MAQAKQAGSKSRKANGKKASASQKKRVTAGKASGKMSMKKTAAKSAPRKTHTSKSSRTRRYTPGSRYQTFKVGDQVRFDQIQNWESDSVMEHIVGTIIDKIDDKALGLKFIEVQFDFSSEHQASSDEIVMRRFIVK